MQQNRKSPRRPADGDSEDALAAAYERALALEKAGERHAAATAWRAVLALDPADHGGAAIRLAALGEGDTPAKAPPAYVETLFDQHAEAFDDILVDQLGYAVPLQLRQMLLDHAPGPYARALDLGCGTGLTGSALTGIAAHVIGIDIAENMVALAEERDVYDGLYVAEIEDFLLDITGEENWDLIAATDVLPYLGDLTRFFAGAAARLNPLGLLGFSTETLPAAELPAAGYKVGSRQRFAHGEAHIRVMLDRHGFDIVALAPIRVRMEDDQPIPGHLVLARLRG